MPRVDRAQRFLVNPHAWTDDPAVQRMSLEARGAYAALWLSGWDQKEPGVYLNDDRVLSQLARCSPEEWARVRDMVLPAFVTDRDMLVLPHFRVTYQRQNHHRDTERNRQRRKRQRDRDVTTLVTRDLLDGSGSGSGTEESKPVVRPSVSLFDEFWDESPKKVGKKPAFTKWKRLVNGSETLGREIISGLRRLKPTWNPGYEPNPLTFLNQERWKDEPKTNGHAAPSLDDYTNLPHWRDLPK